MTFEKDVLTTGEVAKLCNVAPRTASKWFDSGQLRGYRIPGSKDRRIPLEHLIRFMKAHGIPLNGFLHVGDDPERDVRAAQRLGLSNVWVNRHGRDWPVDTPRADLEVVELSALVTILLD